MHRMTLKTYAASAVLSMSTAVGLAACATKADWEHQSATAPERNRSSATYVTKEHLSQCEAGLNAKSIFLNNNDRVWRLNGPLRRDDRIACLMAMPTTVFGGEYVFFAAPAELVSGTPSDGRTKNIYHCMFLVNSDHTRVTFRGSSVGITMKSNDPRAYDEFAKRCGYKLEEAPKPISWLDLIYESLAKNGQDESKPQ